MFVVTEAGSWPDKEKSDVPYINYTAQLHTRPERLEGDLAYIDRAYALTALSETLTGARLIQTPNDDKSQSANNELQFAVDRQATVYVCYSEVATAPPVWLTGWSLTSELCSTTDGGSPDRVVYRRTVNAGVVMLGGKREGPAAGPGDYSNYLVIVGL